MPPQIHCGMPICALKIQEKLSQWMREMLPPFHPPYPVEISLGYFNDFRCFTLLINFLLTDLGNFKSNQFDLSEEHHA